MISIISSTNRPNSNTFKVAQFYKNELQKKGCESQILDLCNLPTNLLEDNTYKTTVSGFKEFQEGIDQSQKLLFVIPEYNGSFPGILKLMIDTCDFPHTFLDKKVALVGISTGKYGNIRGVDHFTGIAHYCQMQVMPLKLHIPAIHTELDENGNITKEQTLHFIIDQIEKFILF